MTSAKYIMLFFLALLTLAAMGNPWFWPVMILFFVAICKMPSEKTRKRKD